MKNLMRRWKKFLSENTIKLEGILAINPDDMVLSEVEAQQYMLPEEAIRIPRDKIHVTLIHQSILKPFEDQLQKEVLPDPPGIILEDEVWERESMGKKSWAIRLKNQEEMREYVKQVMELLGSQNTNPEPERVFHVSLANLTGNPHDSVR